MAAKKKASAKKVAVKKTRKRARTEDGHFKADAPAPPDVNEAFVQPEASSEPSDEEQARREAQRKKFAPPAAGSGARYLGGKLV